LAGPVSVITSISLRPDHILTLGKGAIRTERQRSASLAILAYGP
jgi:hypothetical protein